MTTTEKNKLIAEFMGWKNKGNDYFFPNNMQHLYNPINLYEFEGGDYQFETDVTGLTFHTSWDWLMPVVEKIESLGYSVNTSSSMVYINGDNGIIKKPINIGFKITKIEAVYNACVEFILWYNAAQKD